jgi:hypothetical protein
MQILEQVSNVAEAIKAVSVDSAITLMAELDVADAVNLEFMEALEPDCFFLEMATLAGNAVFFLDEETRTSVKKDAQKDARLQHTMKPAYHGIPKQDADVGHAAFSRSRRAMGVSKDRTKTDLEKQHAHVKAYRAHEYARNHFKSKGHELAAHVHHKAMGYHDVQIDQHAKPAMKMAEDTRSVRKDQRKMDAIKTSVTPLYTGVPDKVAKWGHEAHAEGLRAHGMERDPKAPIAMKLKAHHEAQQAHSLAANKLSQAGHDQPAMLHKQAASYHGSRKSALSSKDPGALTAEDMPDVRSIPAQMHVAAWRLKNITKKKKATPAPTLPKMEWMDRIDEGEYSDAVKNASKMAANASKAAKEPNATPEHHDTAARMHFVAHGIAQSHGHADLAAKHMDFVQKHRALAKAPQTATGT